jgi:hypothetical protein
MKVTTLDLQFHWPDRRPIAAMHVADGSHQSPTNPGSWLFDQTVDTTTEAGLKDFAKRFDEWADRAILVMKELNAQGMICWEIDGGRFPDQMYLGSPDYANALNPELIYGRHGPYGNIGGVVYDFFKKFRDNHFKVGVCIRPCEFNIETHKMEDSKNPYETLLRKAKYAHEQWGCRMFYVDTNTYHVADFPILPATIFARLHRALPGCLFAPEHEDIWYPTEYKYEDYYLYTAPYAEARMNEFEVEAKTLRNIPKAFQVINCSGGDTKNPDVQRKLVDSVKRGNILMIDGWWRNDQIQDIIDIYKMAAT